MRKKILILGGIKEAVECAHFFHNDPRFDLIYSLSGRVEPRIAYPFKIRVGGLGGEIEFENFILGEKIDLILNATHPFAKNISERCETVSKKIGIKNIRFCRPAWQQNPQDLWSCYEDIETAIEAIPNHSKCFMALGTYDFAQHFKKRSLWVLSRSITAPDWLNQQANNYQGKHIIELPPYSLDNEKALLQKYEIDCLVTKNAGGTGAYAKIIAARELGIKVYMVNQPVCNSQYLIRAKDEAIRLIYSILGINFS